MVRAHGTVRVVPSAAEVAPGEDLTVEIIVETDHPLGAFGFTFTCDDAAMTLTPPVHGGTTTEFTGDPIQNVTAACAVSFGNFQAQSLESPTGTVSVARIDLHVNEDAGADPASELVLGVEELTDTDGNAIEFSVEPSAVAIAGATNMCGDVNGDGKLSAADALGALRAAVGLEECPVAVCDVDQSGAVSAGDALRILATAVGTGEVDCA
jgi:hypothetical protein